MSFEKYLEELGDVKAPLTTPRLKRLSDLLPEAEESKALKAFWPSIVPARRERIVRLLVELTEDDVKLDFEDLFRFFLDDPDEAIRVAAIDGLSECTHRWLLDRLIQIVRTDKSEKVRAAAARVEALGRFALAAELGELRPQDADRIDEALLAAFNDENESLEVRRRAIESLGVRSTDQVVAAIKRAYASDKRDLRVGALYAMGHNCDERWLSIILKELKNPDPEMRYEAANACGEMEDQRTVPYLVPLLQDSDILVRTATIMALGHIGGPRAKAELQRCLQNPDEQIRDAAEDALEEISFNDEPFSFGLGSDL